MLAALADVSGSEALKCIMILQRMSFPQFMQSYLVERQAKQIGYIKSELYDYLIDRGFEIEKTSMYRYFNPHAKTNRMPSREFVTLFADFLNLSDFERAAVFDLWEYYKHKNRRNGARKKEGQKKQFAA